MTLSLGQPLARYCPLFQVHFCSLLSTPLLIIHSLYPFMQPLQPNSYDAIHMNGNLSTMKQRISSAKKFTCTRDEHKTVLPWVLQHVVSCWSGACSPFNCTLSTTLCTGKRC